MFFTGWVSLRLWAHRGRGRCKAGRRKIFFCISAHLKGQSDLSHVERALRAASTLPGPLHCRQKESYECADDRDYDQEFHERKTVTHTCEITAAECGCEVQAHLNQLSMKMKPHRRLPAKSQRQQSTQGLPALHHFRAHSLGYYSKTVHGMCERFVSAFMRIA